MPQMAPTMWLTLFLLVALSIFTISSYLFFISPSTMSTSASDSLTKNTKTWLW